jgi:hypothetical protein
VEGHSWHLRYHDRKIFNRDRVKGKLRGQEFTNFRARDFVAIRPDRQAGVARDGSRRLRPHHPHPQRFNLDAFATRGLVYGATPALRIFVTFV